MQAEAELFWRSEEAGEVGGAGEAPPLACPPATQTETEKMKLRGTTAGGRGNH